MNDNNLSGEIPESILNISSLRILKLYKNNLSGEIPHLGNLPLLSAVNLSHNKLSGNITQEMIPQQMISTTSSWASFFLEFKVTANCLNDLSSSFIGWFLDQPDSVTDWFYFYPQGTLEHCRFRPATDINGVGVVKEIVGNGRFDKQGNRIPSRTEKQMLPREFFTKTPPKDKLELDVKEYMPELDVKADSRVMKKVAPKKSEKR